MYPVYLNTTTRRKYVEAEIASPGNTEGACSKCASQEARSERHVLNGAISRLIVTERHMRGEGLVNDVMEHCLLTLAFSVPVLKTESTC